MATSDRKKLLYNFAAQFSTGIMGILFVPIYINNLGVESYGIIGFLSVLQVWILLLDAGLTPTLGREMARFSGGQHSPESIWEMLRTLETVIICLAIVSSGAVFLSSNLIVKNWLNVSESLNMGFAIKIMALIIGLKFLDGLYRAALLGLQEQVLVSKVSITMAILRHCGAVIIVYFKPNIDSFLCWQLLVSATTVCCYLIFVYSILPSTERSPKFAVEKLQSIKSFTTGMIIVTVINMGLSQADKFFVSYYASLKSYGYYTFAATVAAGLHFFVSPIITTYYPKFAKLVAENNPIELEKVYELSTTLIVVITLPITVVLVLYPSEIIEIWSGNAVLAQQSATFVQLLVLGTFANTLVWMPYQFQLGHGWTNLSVRINAITLLLAMVSWYLLVPQYGGLAAASTWVAINVLLVILNVALMHRKLLIGKRRRWMKNNFLPILVLFIIGWIGKQIYLNFRLSNFETFIWIMLVYLLIQYAVIKMSPVFYEKVIKVIKTYLRMI